MVRIRVGLHDSNMRFHRYVAHCRQGELVLEHQIALGKCLFYIALAVLIQAGNIGIRLGEEYAFQVRDIVDIFVHEDLGFQSLVQRSNRLQGFVIHLDQGQCLLSDLFINRGHGCHGLTLVAGFAAGHHFFILHVQPYFEVCVFTGDHGFDSGQSPGSARVDGADFGAGVGREHDLAMQHAGQFQVEGITCLTGYLLARVFAGIRLANMLVLGFVIGMSGHDFNSALSRSAAAFTAARMGT